MFNINLSCLLVGKIACLFTRCISLLFLIVGGPKPCSSNPCGANAVCQDTQNGAGYICTCKEGYTGQPFRGCTGKTSKSNTVYLFLKLRILRTK